MEKAATIYLLGPAQPVTPPEVENCEPVYSPLLDYRTVNLPVPLTVDGTYHLQQLVTLAPCHIRAGAVCMGDILKFIQFQHMEQPCYNNNIILFISR